LLNKQFKKHTAIKRSKKKYQKKIKGKYFFEIKKIKNRKNQVIILVFFKTSARSTLTALKLKRNKKNKKKMLLCVHFSLNLQLSIINN